MNPLDVGYFNLYLSGLVFTHTQRSQSQFKYTYEWSIMLLQEWPELLVQESGPALRDVRRQRQRVRQQLGRGQRARRRRQAQHHVAHVCCPRLCPTSVGRDFLKISVELRSTLHREKAYKIH